MKKILGIGALVAVVSGCVSYPDQVDVKAYVDTTVQPLRVLVSIDGGKAGDAYDLSGYLQSNLEGALVERGYRVVYEGSHEILVSTCGPVMCELLNSRGSKVVYRGDADVQVTRAPLYNAMNDQTMRDVVARQRFDVQGGESRDRTDGIKSVADTLGPPLSQWVAESVSSIAGKLERCEVTIQNAWSYRGEESYPSRFTATVNRMRGVYRCRILATDNAARSIRAEVIYDRDMFPDGFVNALIATRDLNLYR